MYRRVEKQTKIVLCGVTITAFSSDSCNTVSMNFERCSHLRFGRLPSTTKIQKGLVKVWGDQPRRRSPSQSSSNTKKSPLPSLMTITSSVVSGGPVKIRVPSSIFWYGNQIFSKDRPLTRCKASFAFRPFYGPSCSREEPCWGLYVVKWSLNVKSIGTFDGMLQNLLSFQ